MAYIIGAANEEEIKELVIRGWTIGEPPPELRYIPGNSGDKMIMIYVDNDLFKIMSGPDWEK